MSLALPSKADPRRASMSSQTTVHLATTTIAVEGMTCGACTSAIESAFENTPGIGSFTVSLITERAVATHDPTVISAAEIAETIEDRGFDARVLSTDLPNVPHPRMSYSKENANLITTIAVEGMTCGACTAAIDGAFEGMLGVLKHEVSLLTERFVAVHDPRVVSAEKIVEEIEDRGFGATILDSIPVESEQRNFRTEQVVFNLHGLHTREVADALEAKLSSLSGIESATITLKDAKCRLTYSSALIGIRTIAETIDAEGVNAVLADSEDNNAQLESLSKTREIKEWRYAFYFSLCFAIPVFFLSMIVPMWFKGLNRAVNKREILVKGLFLGDLICLVLTLPVQFGIGKRFYKSAWKGLKHGSSTMDLLVVMGTSAAFFFSLLSMSISILCAPHNRPSVVFDTSTMLITFITLGRYLENNAKGHTSTALSRLMSLAPSMATIYADPKSAPNGEKSVDPNNAGHEEKMIATDLIQVDDIVILRPGDKIPADGTVTAGSSYVNESMVTGEPMPIQKRPGDALIGGTVNGSGRLDFRVTRAGRDTQLSQIVMMVQSAQTKRAPIQQYADKIAGYFVPTILALGILTFFVWMILAHVLPSPPAVFTQEAAGGSLMVCLKLCISVIVFACPCALGLSTPTAVMVGTGVGAENGILFKGGPQLEATTRVKKVVFDKTGTLTYGKMTVSRARPSEVWKGEWRQRVWWSIIGLAENSSEHPIGRAIVAAAKEALGLGPDGTLDGGCRDFEAVVGQGLTAEIRPSGSDPKFYKVLMGNEKLLLAHDIALPTSDPLPDENPTATKIHIAIDGLYAGSLALADTIKPTAARAVSYLQRKGYSVAMVTGDALPTALSVALAIGIPKADVYAGFSPSDKRSLIERLQKEGTPCAMVGDGINDSPALATSTLGIALSSGTDIAIESADLVLMRPASSHLLDIPAALDLANTIYGRIKLNMGWACAYNLIGLPFAMGVFLPWGWALHPMAAGGAMAGSSVSVVCSSLLLKLWRKPRGLEEVESEETSWFDGLGRVWARVMPGGKGRGVYVPLREMDNEV